MARPTAWRGCARARLAKTRSGEVIASGLHQYLQAFIARERSAPRGDRPAVQVPLMRLVDRPSHALSLQHAAGAARAAAAADAREHARSDGRVMADRTSIATRGCAPGATASAIASTMLYVEGPLDDDRDRGVGRGGDQPFATACCTASPSRCRRAVFLRSTAADRRRRGDRGVRARRGGGGRGPLAALHRLNEALHDALRASIAGGRTPG